MKKDQRYYVSDTRKITIVDSKEFDNRVELNVANDFIVTDEWVEEVMKDPNMYQCLIWLNKKGFTEDENGVWNYQGDKAREYRLPLYFIDQKNRKLTVKLGKINHAKSIVLPYFKGGLCSIDEFPEMPESRRLYMNYTSDEMYDDLSWFELSFLHAYNGYYMNGNDDGNRTRNQHYYGLLFKMMEIDETHSKNNYFLKYKHLFYLDSDFKKIENSFKAIGKFNL